MEISHRYLGIFASCEASASSTWPISPDKAEHIMLQHPRGIKGAIHGFIEGGASDDARDDSALATRVAATHNPAAESVHEIF